MQNKLIDDIFAILEENKLLELKRYSPKGYIASSVFLAVCLSERQCSALCDDVVKFLKDNGIYGSLIDGKNCDWTALDIESLGLIIHFMTQEKSDALDLAKLEFLRG